MGAALFCHDLQLLCYVPFVRHHPGKASTEIRFCFFTTHEILFLEGICVTIQSALWFFSGTISPRQAQHRNTLLFLLDTGNPSSWGDVRGHLLVVQLSLSHYLAMNLRLPIWIYGRLVPPRQPQHRNTLMFLHDTGNPSRGEASTHSLVGQLSLSHYLAMNLRLPIESMIVLYRPAKPLIEIHYCF